MNDDYNHTTLKKKRIAKPLQDPSTSSSVLQQVKNAASSAQQIKPDTTEDKFSNRIESMAQHPKEEKKPVISLKKPFVKSKENDKGRSGSNTETSSPTVASTSDIPDHILYVFSRYTALLFI